jgi:hypothetical protein
VLVAGLLVIGLVLAIAAGFVVHEAGRLTKQPPAVVFSLDEAFDWVVEELPDDVAATLTPEDVYRILSLQVEYFDRTGVATNGSSGAESRPPAVVGAAEIVDFIVDRAAATGDAFIPEQVYPVVEILLEYLRATGAVSSPADPDHP